MPQMKIKNDIKQIFYKYFNVVSPADYMVQTETHSYHV